MNILYTKPLPFLQHGARSPATVSRDVFETASVRDMLVRMAHASQARLTPSALDAEREIIVHAVTACFSALINLAINCHQSEPERLDMCATPEVVHLMHSFSGDDIHEDIVTMVAGLMRIMAVSPVCKHFFSCVPVRDMFTRMLSRRTKSDTKLKLAGALVILFDKNTVPFSLNVQLFSDPDFRHAVLQSHLTVSSHTLPDVMDILDSIDSIKRRCACVEPR
jgi:hypothetical protein